MLRRQSQVAIGCGGVYSAVGVVDVVQHAIDRAVVVLQHRSKQQLKLLVAVKGGDEYGWSSGSGAGAYKT